MEYSGLYDMIRFLQNGTRLHIGVLFFGNFGGKSFTLPNSQRIHSSEACREFKEREGGFRRCYRCRQLAIEKALRERKDFGGYCINGVYEYTRPVVIDGEVAAIIYIGNILRREGSGTRIKRLLGEPDAMLATMEQEFDEESCRALGKLIESYIRALWDQETKHSDGKKPSLIENIKGYIAANLEYGISLSDTAQLFHYNGQYLGRLFKRETGMSFAEYVNRERVKLAAEYLKDGSSVISIAYRVGFNNVTYFNRMFKRYFGCTPIEYKKSMNAN